MKLSYNWLKQYVNIDLDPEELSTVLTDIGLEVEGLEKFHSVKGGLEGVVAGEVMTCEKHPNADKLSVTTVDVGEGEHKPVVCGAPNVAKGQKVLVATVGTTLYAGDESFEIKKARIRGKVSEGMICAEDELGLGTSHEGIMVLPEEVLVGTPAKEYFAIEEDYVYEIGLTPNRTDAMSHIGSARDLVAGLNRLFNTRKYRLSLPSVDEFATDNNDLDIDIVVEDTEACPRYTGVTMTGLKVGESPAWLKNRLNAIGLRPINNIVDVTNYVLHETGQPLHAFDADGIKGNQVVIRKMPKDTPFITLDEEERKLNENDLMICNAENGMCIAGVFGGIGSGVTEKTTNLFLESAYFDPGHVRKTSKRHALQTDASFRFERGADPNITAYALKRAVLLFKELAGGKISSEIKDVYPEPIPDWFVDVSYKNTDRLIGKQIERSIIKDILDDLEMKVAEELEEGIKLKIPTFKVDVTREADVIEEIIRIYGFNNIQFNKSLSVSVNVRQKPDPEKLQNMIADYLSAKSFKEIMNNSLTKSDYYINNKEFDAEASVPLVNPLSKDLDILRQSLVFGGLEVIAYNSNRKISDQKLYEFGKVYLRGEKVNTEKPLSRYFEEKHLALFTTGRLSPENWNTEDRKADFYFMKDLLEGVIRKLGIVGINARQVSSTNYTSALDYIVDGKVLATVAEISKLVLMKFDIKEKVYYADVNWDLVIKKYPKGDIQYKPVTRFPAVRRDLALLVDKQIKFDELKDAALKAERRLLKRVGIFDIYEGDKIPEGKKSYALSFTLQDEQKTLTEKVIDKTMRRIQQVLEKEFHAELR